MDVQIRGPGPAAPFLSAQDRFETAYDLSRPVDVHIRENPDERTWTSHYEDRHVLNISSQAVTSAMAIELVVHEYAHMRRYEEGHPSHTQSTEEALYLALAGQKVQSQQVTHCYQIANHIKDIYADDITLSIGPADKLVKFFESGLAATLSDHQHPAPAHWTRLTGTADPEMTAINAAFALALLERNDAIPTDHHIYDLAAVAGRDAPRIDLTDFKNRFRGLGDVDSTGYRKVLVDAFREFLRTQPQSGAD